MPNITVKCTKCGATKDVNPSNVNGSEIKYKCSKCNQEFKTEFFDCCPNCHTNVGFYDNGKLEVDGKELLNIGIYFAKSFFNLGTAVKNLSVKDANGTGLCPICKSRFVRCPKCNELSRIPSNLGLTESAKCVHCGVSMYPHVVLDGMGNKHSKEFYKH